MPRDHNVQLLSSLAYIHVYIETPRMSGSSSGTPAAVLVSPSRNLPPYRPEPAPKVDITKVLCGPVSDVAALKKCTGTTSEARGIYPAHTAIENHGDQGGTTDCTTATPHADVIPASTFGNPPGPRILVQTACFTPAFANHSDPRSHGPGNGVKPSSNGRSRPLGTIRICPAKQTLLLEWLGGGAYREVSAPYRQAEYYIIDLEEERRSEFGPGSVSYEISVYAWKPVERDNGCGRLAGDARDAASSGLVKSVSSCMGIDRQHRGEEAGWDG
jgi:hypothetical protein